MSPFKVEGKKTLLLMFCIEGTVINIKPRCFPYHFYSDLNGTTDTQCILTKIVKRRQNKDNSSIPLFKIRVPNKTEGNTSTNYVKTESWVIEDWTFSIYQKGKF